MLTHRSLISLAAAGRLAAVVGFLALAHVTMAGPAHAGALNDVWFKVTVNATGMTVDAGGNVQPAKFKTIAYMHLLDDSGGYDYAIYTQTVPGTWADTYDSWFRTFGANENLYVDEYMSFYSGGVGVAGYQTSEIVIKRDKFGALKKATISTLGAEVTDGTLNGKMFAGGYKMKAVSIDVSDLPF